MIWLTELEKETAILLHHCRLNFKLLFVFFTYKFEKTEQSNRLAHKDRTVAGTFVSYHGHSLQFAAFTMLWETIRNGQACAFSFLMMALLLQ